MKGFEKSRNRFRFLKFLFETQQVRFTSFEGAGGACSLLHAEAGSGPKLAMMNVVLKDMATDGLITLTGDKIAITPAGISCMKREAATMEGDSDGGFGAQHRQLRRSSINLNGTATTVQINDNESPLARLRSRTDKKGKPWIDDAAFLAGERLRAQFTSGALMQKVSSNWDFSSAGTGGRSSRRLGKVDITDQAIDARAGFEAALDCVGPELAGVLTDVCCFLKGLETVERERQWPPRSAKLMLRTGLNLLARYYGTRAGGGTRQPKASFWLQEGARPRLDPDRSASPVSGGQQPQAT